MNVLDKQCKTCIFRPGNPMKLRPGRVKQMVADCERDDSFIPCHEYMKYVHEWADDDAEADYETSPDSPVCRGFYDNYPHLGQLIRIMGRLGNLHFVNANGDRVKRNDSSS